MPIYTRKGDKGETGLFSNDKNNPVRIDKDSLRVEAIGSIDELDSFIGVTKSKTEDVTLIRLLEIVQRNLLTIGSTLAGSGLGISKTETTKLEKMIDAWDKHLPPLKNFILPGGTEVSGNIHYCRSLARRAERRVVSLSKMENVHPNILMYLNRLSDYFFQMARFANHSMGVADVPWIPQK